MTETRTNRHGLPQWSSGTDSGSRADFNEAFDKLNDQAAYDDGVDAATLPVAGVVAGRYALVTLAGGYRTLHRRAADATWDPIGGNTMPRAFHYRALEGQARTDTAVTFSHPGSANPGATLDYGGSAVLSGTVRIFDDDEPTRGALVVGTSAAVDLATLGRVHVRTRAEAERGIVVRPYGDASGNLFTTQSTGGVDLLSVDALSRLRQQAVSAFGGASLPTASVVAISPTSSGSDDIVNGLLLYGQAAADTKSILRIQPDNTADLVPIGLFTRTGISLGRLPWGTPGTALGTITYAANTHHVRVSGHASNTSYFNVKKSDVTSSATELDTTKDISLFTVGSAGIGTGLPLFVSQRQRLTSATMALYRVTDFSAPFLDLARLVPDGGGVEQAQIASTWASDGKLSTGAWWKGTGVVRDARQPVKHISRKWFALPETGGSVGQAIDTGQTFTYTWAAMTVRSPTTTDLEAVVSLEFIETGREDGIADTNSFLVETLISVNGGGYTVGDATHITMPVVLSAARVPGSTLTTSHRMTAVPAGASFTLRTRITMGASLPDMRLRMLDIVATEGLHEVYAAP